MNWVVGATVVLYLGAALWSAASQDWRMSVVWFCYGVANAALMGVSR